MNLFKSAKSKKPNIIFILIDGGGREEALDKVPFYQSLKEQGVFVRNLITYAPYSIGSLNALFSGMYGNINGVNGYYKAYNFDKNILTLPQYLKEAGYHTELDFVIEDALPAQGFDKIRIFGKDETREIDLAERHSEILTQLKGKQPFFVFFDYNKIALSLLANVIRKYDDFSEEYFSNKEKNFSNYLGWLRESSNYTDKILKKIKELGMYENSIIVIFADHGESIGDRAGEKVHGVFLYDYTIKCWVYIIGKGLPRNVEVSETARHIDLMPTILDILKIPPKEGYKTIQGKSLIPLINGKDGGRTAYSETGGLGGPTPSPEIHNIQCVRTNKWKLIYNRTSKKKELYSLENDPREKDNLAGKGLKIENELWEEMQRIEKEHNDANERFKSTVSSDQEDTQ